MPEPEVQSDSLLPLLRFAVRKEHIDHAVRRDSKRCMVANAIRDEVPWASFIMVDSQSIRLSNYNTGQRFVYMTPPKVQQALLDFDDNKPVKPMSVNVRLGFVRRMRVRQGTGQMVRKPRVRNRKSPPKRYMPARYREFGIRVARTAEALGEQP